MKKIIILAIAILGLAISISSCSNNYSSYSAYVPLYPVQENDSLRIMKARVKDLYENGTGTVTKYKIAYNDTRDNWDVAVTSSVEDYYIKSDYVYNGYNSNTRSYQVEFDGRSIVVFKDKDEMLCVINAIVPLLNKKVANDDFVDFPILENYELRIERGGGCTTYRIKQNCDYNRNQSLMINKQCILNLYKELNK